MSGSLAAIHDFRPLNDFPFDDVPRPVAGDSPGGPQEIRGSTVRDDRSYHKVGRALIETVARTGRREAASAAIEVFRVALNGAPGEAAFLNGLGTALVELAYLEQNAAAVEALTEASQYFRAALEAVTEQGAPLAVRERYQVNLAMVSWILGDLLDDADRIKAAAETLRSILTEQPDEPARLSVDRARAQDILGNALMTLGRPEEAAAAYQAAIDRWDDPIERARSLNHLATAYAEEGRFTDARRAFARALALLSPAYMPLPWGLTQYNLGVALFREAESRKSSRENIKLLSQAIEAFEDARDAHRQIQLSQHWLVITIGLANARLSYGTDLYLSNRAEDRQIGIDEIVQALTLYKEAIPHLSPAQLKVGLTNTRIALQILGKLSRGKQEKARLSSHLIDVIALRVAKFGPPGAALLISLLRYPTKITTDMGKDADLVIAEILDILASSELPKAEWPRILRAAISRIEPASAEAAQLPIPDNVTAKTSSRFLAPLPPGLHWPSETYQEARRKGKVGGIIEFLNDPEGWRPLIEAGAVSRAILREHDPAAEIAVSNHLRNTRGKWPAHLHLPTKQELTDRALAAYPDPATRPYWLERALQERVRRQSGPKG